MVLRKGGEKSPKRTAVLAESRERIPLFRVQISMSLLEVQLKKRLKAREGGLGSKNKIKNRIEGMGPGIQHPETEGARRCL